MEEAEFEGWAILELMEHRRMPGYLSTAQIGGTKLLRIDVPGEVGEPNALTQFYGVGAIYCVTPVSEDVARAMARHERPQPVSVYELKLPAPKKYGGAANWVEGSECPNCDGRLEAGNGDSLHCSSCHLTFWFDESRDEEERPEDEIDF